MRLRFFKLDWPPAIQIGLTSVLAFSKKSGSSKVECYLEAREMLELSSEWNELYNGVMDESKVLEVFAWILFENRRNRSGSQADKFRN